MSKFHGCHGTHLRVLWVAAPELLKVPVSVLWGAPEAHMNPSVLLSPPRIKNAFFHQRLWRHTIGSLFMLSLKDTWSYYHHVGVCNCFCHSIICLIILVLVLNLSLTYREAFKMHMSEPRCACACVSWLLWMPPNSFFYKDCTLRLSPPK